MVLRLDFDGVINSGLVSGVGVYSTIFVFAFHVHKRVTGRREGRDDDHEARGRHKKVNSQTVQLVNPTGSDPDDHVNEEEEVRIDLFSTSLFFVLE